jgi:hypothetical protein
MNFPFFLSFKKDFEIDYFFDVYSLEEVKIHVGAFDHHDFVKEKEIDAIFLYHYHVLVVCAENVF